MHLAHLARLVMVAWWCILASAAQAQLFRTYLSAAGNDGNPCTLQQPCRLLPAALNAVADGGEIWILDSANYNVAPVIIGKSVSILAEPGAIGSVVANGTAISISGTGVRVMLTNLVIIPAPGASGGFGVTMSAADGGLLVIDKTTFARLTQGVDVNTAADVRVSNSGFANIGGTGISLSGGATADISTVKMTRIQSFGIAVSSASGTTTRAAATDVTIERASNCGVFAITSGGPTQLFLTRVTITGSNGAVCSQGGAAALVSLNETTLQGNVFGAFFSTPGSIIASFGNNAIANNTSGDVVGGSLTPVAPR